jgi:hypothetical protein
MICTVLPTNIFCGNSIISTIDGFKNVSDLILCAIFLNSFIVDWLLRQKVSANINMFYVYQLPIPRINDEEIVIRAAKLICTTPEFDDLAKEVGLESGVTNPEERAEIRAELDAMVAHLYGLTYEEFRHILGTFPIVGEEIKERALEIFKKYA